MDKNKTLTEMLGNKTLYLPPFGWEYFAAYSPTLCTKWQLDIAFINHDYCSGAYGPTKTRL